MNDLAQLKIADRIKFHEAAQVLEVDFSRLTFASADDVARVYDEVDRRLAASGRRWYFLVDYQDCVIEPAAWDAFATRGKKTNFEHSTGTVRIGVKDDTRKVMSDRSQKERFRTNTFATREEAFAALANMRRRHQGLLTGRTAAPGRATDILLSVEDVSLRFGGVRAIQNVSFEIERGEIFAIIGPNGAGKTSMLNVINGFYHPQEGAITFKGARREAMRPYIAASQGIARTFQNVALFKGMSTLDNIMTGRTLKMRRGLFWQMLRTGPALREEVRHREAVERIIDFLEINHIRKVPVGKLPYGLQKRVELGRALAMEPELLLLDEPMAGMNLEEKEDMSRFILTVNDTFNTTVALIEHDMGVVMDLSNFVVVLEYGRKIADGTPDEVKTNQKVIDAYLGVAH